MTRVRLLLVVVCAAVLAAPALARAGSTGVVVSQLFGGGGNGGASLRNDFVELFNRGSAAVDLGGWTLQYATASSETWQRAPLSGSIAPGRYLLVQLASTSDTGAPLPTPDVIGSINLSASSGKVALVRDGAALACGASPGSCSANPLVEDLVGYGTAADYEGSGAAPGLGSTTAAARAGDGCVDTDANAADFSAAPPGPRNSSTPAHSCGGDTAPSVVATVPAPGAGDVAVDATIAIAFSEPVVAADGWYAIACTASGLHGATASGGPVTFVLGPVGAFAPGETCTVTISAAAVRDADADDPPDMLAADHVFAFTTASPPPPAPPPGVSAEAAVDADVPQVLTIALERSRIDFGRLFWNAPPAPISQHVTVASNAPDGYALTVQRSPFAPDDLPLAIGADAPPPPRQLGDAFGGGGLVRIPIAPQPDLLVGTSASASAGGGDVWATSIGFATPIPLTRAGHHSATLTFTVIAR